MKAKFIVIAMLAGIACSAQKSIDKAHFYSLIKDRKYGQLLTDAHKERNKVYGKIWLVDYYIAKASCGLGKPVNAVEWFNSSLKYPNVNDEIRNFLLEEMGNCTSGHNDNARTVSAVGLPDIKLLTQAYMPTATSRGKMGAVYNCKIPPQAITTMREVSIDELESRLFGVDDGVNAIKKYKTLLNNNYHINVSGRFLLITYGNNVLNNEQIEKTSKSLQRAYDFFSSYYNLRQPDKLLAVYLLPDKKTLRETALRVHGVKIPDANIGYSNLSDLSLVGVSDITRIGTLCHELFHLMIRTDVGDVSPWMDEGIASIYETSRWNGNELKGDYENWRTEVLRTGRNDMPEKVPHLNNFLNFTWQQFDGLESNDLCKAAINYAYGKHFMLYCQDKGKLAELVTAVKNRTEVPEGTDAVFQSDSALLEKVFNINLAAIEKNFNDWLGKKYGIRLESPLILSDEPGRNDVISHSDQPVSAVADVSDTGIQVVQKQETPDANNQVMVQQMPVPVEIPDANNQVMVQQMPVPVETPDDNNQVMIQQMPVPVETPDANNQVMLQQMPVDAAFLNAANMNQQSLPRFDANDVVNSLSVHVKTDDTDKMGDAIAYSYYLDGESAALDQIAEVNYQRNHESFQEFKSKSYKKSREMGSNFLFKGYQWGFVENVYVYVVMKDNSKSDVVLKTIVYDN